MKVVIQRVTQARVDIDGSTKGSIGQGLMVLVGFTANDTAEDVEWMCGKILRLRIFDDEQGVMNLSVSDIHGQILVVSQFTLYASTRKGNRPSYVAAAAPPIAIPLYELFVSKLSQLLGREVPTGKFGAHMEVTLTNNGPVTIIIDSKKRE